MIKRKGRRMESDKYVGEWYDDLSRRQPSSNPFPKGDPLLGQYVNHQGQMRQKA
jgi:hypothetical protein